MPFIINPSRFEVAGGGAFLPTDVTTATLEAWYDATDAATITESGGLVSQWDDKSGNGRDVSQATGSLQPTTGVETIGGENAISFVTDVLVAASAFNYNSPDYTIFFVTELVSFGFSNEIFGASSADEMSFGTSTALRLRNTTVKDVVLSPAVSLATPYIVAIRAIGTALEVYIGGDNIRGSYTSAVAEKFRTRAVGGGAVGDGGSIILAENFGFTGAVSDTEFNQLGNTLATKYSLGWVDI